MSKEDVLTRAKVLLDEGLTPGYWASWEEHPAQPVMVDLVAEVESLRWRVKHGGDHVCDECWPPEPDEDDV